MKRTTLRKILIATALAGATALGATAFAQGGYGYGPGYGMGPGMMGGWGGYGPGYGMGPGMMWGYGGSGRGGWGMGPGMMWGYGSGGYAGLDLSDEQRSKIGAIQQEFSKKQWDLMNTMQEQGYRLYGRGPSGKIDEDAARKAYEAMADARNAVFANSLEARKRIDAVLTKEQREQLASGGYGYWCH